MNGYNRHHPRINSMRNYPPRRSGFKRTTAQSTGPEPSQDDPQPEARPQAALTPKQTRAIQNVLQMAYRASTNAVIRTPPRSAARRYTKLWIICALIVYLLCGLLIWLLLNSNAALKWNPEEKRRCIPLILYPPGRRKKLYHIYIILEWVDSDQRSAGSVYGNAIEVVGRFLLCFWE